MLVVTELVTSGTECISLFPFQEYLVFPEIDDNNELAELEAMVAPVERFFNEDGKDFGPPLLLCLLFVLWTRIILLTKVVSVL